MLSSGSFVLAQEAPTTFRVKAGEDALKVIPPEHQYRYPLFQQGKVVYMNGNFSKATFNYNKLLGEVQFINSKGDTLALAGEPALISVVVGESIYLYNQEEQFLELVEEYASAKLGKRQKFEFAGADKVGAYNQSTGASSIGNTSTYLGSNGQRFKLELKGDVVFSERISYFLVDHRNQFHKATKANVLKMFPKHRKAVSSYLKEHSPDLNKEEDLKALLQFCTSLEV
ncbi:hypothetical protein GCM10027443_01820 [Pontibacter brevis]